MDKVSELFIRIKIGNSAMHTSEQLAKALRNIATRLEHNEYLEASDIDLITRGITDKNGNIVGEFGFKK